MRKRIRNGQYEFPNPEWSQVSEEGNFTTLIMVHFVQHHTHTLCDKTFFSLYSKAAHLPTAENRSYRENDHRRIHEPFLDQCEH